jgi:hypothetical protein
MKATLCALWLSLGCGLVHPTLAADFKSTAAKDGRVLVILSGEIIEGDSDALKAAIKSANDVGKLVANIRLNSEGGSLLEGVKLADAVRFAKISTNVGNNATCASACFLIFAAGQTKFANYTARIGVHGASDKTGSETVQSGAATVSMARVAKDLGVPPAIIGRMVVTPPSEMVWLSPQDLQSMGVTMVGKPAQIPQIAADQPVSRQTLDEPVQLVPGRAQASRTVPTWNEVVEKATNLSASQNNGKANFARFCEPERKTCTSAVTFTLRNGKDGFLKIVEDLNGKTIRRETCEFNEFKDVRTCLNWDDGTSHRDMKNTKGEWHQVSD